MFNPEYDPYISCRTRNTKHPMYRKCATCQHKDYCDLKEEPKPARKVDWFVDHMLLHKKEDFSLIKVLRRLIRILTS